MTTLRHLARLLPVIALALLAACATPPPDELPPPSEAEISALASEIRALGVDVAPEEAARAARIAITYPRRLAVQYDVEDPPIIHNMKVNRGLKPRGLCYQWADDMEARLRQEGFETLELHRAIANSENALRIEHSTVIVSRRGESMWEGIVLDPWRDGGILWWGSVHEDDAYPWLPRQEVFARKRARLRGADG
ncbi:hypothetical protein [Salipiger mucosus]|uniref:Lipoprotein n=1 Tax=Salipiger mucosus DSM 16094 TaxID=1123237 RepID=S9SK87_9RHOB|nr:hypothetical protein [Salipiger mucosus]EPX86789.1 hypothetical protein Salmuc_01437 [Salipiger mucosus DSM 16094]